ncbi:MAG: hypothetical protein II978_06270 [Clostridia bacterium]|nr:hypothetical protein [Clostridia bacterium]
MIAKEAKQRGDFDFPPLTPLKRLKALPWNRYHLLQDRKQYNFLAMRTDGSLLPFALLSALLGLRFFYIQTFTSHNMPFYKAL